MVAKVVEKLGTRVKTGSSRILFHLSLTASILALLGPAAATPATLTESWTLVGASLML